jgi:hypothetical protein
VSLWHFPLYALAMFWPALLAMLVLAVFASKRKLRPLPSWCRLSLVSVFAAVAAQVVLVLVDPFGTYGRPLVRDVVAIALFAAAIPGALAAITAAGLQLRIPVRVRISLGVAFGCIIALVAPVAVLLVRCTSGDCL